MNINKTRWSLLDFDFLEKVVDVFEIGIKHGRNADDWQQREPTEENEKLYFDSCFRHLTKALKSRDLKEKQAHFAAVAANVIILSNLIERR